MYSHKRELALSGSSSQDLCTKNLQVVSFDAEWKEIYVGCFHGDTFTAVCPHAPSVATETPKLELSYRAQGTTEAVALTSAKWCPMESCTVLVLGSQFGLKLFDWDGSTQIMEYDFQEQGIGVDDRLVAGGSVKGIAAIGPHFIACGLHTGTIVLFEVTTDARNFVCRLVDSQRLHAHPITDLASTTITTAETIKDVLVSGDESGSLNIWHLGSAGDGLVHHRKVDHWTKTDTLLGLSLWNKTKEGIIIAGFGSGSIRLMSLDSGLLLSEVSAHLGWITGMDLASTAGLLATCAEDGYIRVWKLSADRPKKMIDHVNSTALPDCLPTGVKFLDPKGASLAAAVYDTNKIQIFY